MGIDELNEMRAKYERELYIAEARVSVINELIEKFEAKSAIEVAEEPPTEQTTIY
jgi:hypothetical protein